MPTFLYRILPIVAAITLILYLFLSLRSRRIKETYVYLWFVLGACMLILAIWPAAAYRAADFLGFQTPSNMLLAACCFFLLINAISLSISLSALQEDRRRLVEESALHAAELRQIEQRLHNLEHDLQSGSFS